MKRDANMGRFGDQAFDDLLCAGLELYQQERYDAALPFFRMAYSGRPDDLRAVKLLASCCQLTGFKRQARGLYKQALEIAPNQTDALTNLAEILIGQLAYNEALVLLERAIELDPSYEDPCAQRARALVMQVMDDLTD